MLALRGIQAFQTPNNQAFFHGGEFIRRKKPNLQFNCKATDSSSDLPREGDIRKQELLARIAMLQAQKMQLTDYLDERSEYLTQFAEEATIELDQIGENALKELDQAGSRIMDKIESQMQAFEESAELNRREIEESEKKLAEFESQMVEDRNEGMFFKNLGERKPVDKSTAKEEMEKIKDITKKNAGSEARRNVYIALIIIVVLGISNSLVTSSSDLGKVAVLGAILVGLFFQLYYEQTMLSDIEKTDEQKPK